MNLARTLGAAAALMLSACGDDAPAPVEIESAPQPLAGTLDWAVAGAWRSEEDRSRDAALKPVEFFDVVGVDPDFDILEMWPGSGWAAGVLAPYARHGGGSVALAVPPAEPEDDVEALNSRLRERFADTSVFGDVRFTTFGRNTGPLAESNSLDVIFSVRDVHAWMALGFADKAFADAFAALVAGGALVIVEARATEGGVQDPAAPTGYVQASHIRRLAEDAGFSFVAESDLYANPADDHDHPFGVWTLAPYNRTSAFGAAPDPAYDRGAFDPIGEPDQTILIFRKPGS